MKEKNKKILIRFLTTIILCAIIMQSGLPAFAEDFSSEQLVMAESAFSDGMEMEIQPETLAPDPEEPILEEEPTLEGSEEETEGTFAEIPSEMEIPVADEESAEGVEGDEEIPIVAEESLGELEEPVEGIEGPVEIIAAESVETGTFMDAPTSGKCGVNLTWTFAEGKLTISGSGKMEDYGDFSGIQNQPWRNCGSIKTVVIEDGVTNIGNSAFSGCTSLTSITIPSGITDIGYYAFNNCASLTSITIPSGVTEIGGGAFMGCTSLTNITIPSGVTYIGCFAFSRCISLTNVEIPSGIMKIEECMFSYCTSLTSIRIPSGVTEIGEGAFSGCDSLTNVTIPQSVTHIDDYAFKSVPLEAWTKTEGDFAIVNNILIRYQGTDKEVMIPTGVTSIWGKAFRDCTSLTKVTIPASVEHINEWAFAGCTSLTKVTIPASVEYIDEWAFAGCTSLTKVTIPASVKYIDSYAFRDCISLISVTMLEGVEGIGDWAFAGCTSLIDITLPQSLTDIADNAFDGTPWCDTDGDFFIGNGLLIKYVGTDKEVTIPSGVKIIGERAFADCTSLTSVTIPSGVTKIGYGAFENCISLTSITIPQSVTSIGSNAFDGTPWWNGRGEFAAINGILMKYRGTAEKVTIPLGITTIGSSAFMWGSLKSVIIPSGVTSIEKSAFYGCGFLTDITIPSSVTSIGEDAFGWCESLTNIMIPSSVTNIGKKAFGYYFLDEVMEGKITNFTVTGAKGSAAETYAKENGFTFIAQGNESVTEPKPIKLSIPKLVSVENTSTGILFRWEPVSGAVKYRVYYKAGDSSSWKKLTDTAKTSYTRKNNVLVAGRKYTFTVRAIDKNGQVSGFDKNGLAVTYVKPSSVSKLENTVNGIRITWKKSSGAAQYVLYYTGTGSWKKLCKTTKTSYTWKSAKSGKQYKFMVKALAKDGSAAYHDNGRSITYIAAPSGIKAVKYGSTGVKLTWKKSAGAKKYRVFCRIGSGSWVALGDTTKTSYTWKKGIKGIKYTFTVRCISKNGKTFTSAFDSKGVNLKL